MKIGRQFFHKSIVIALTVVVAAGTLSLDAAAGEISPCEALGISGNSLEIRESSVAVSDASALSLDVSYSDLKCGEPVIFTMTPQNGTGPYKYLINTVLLKINGSYTSLVDPTRYAYTDSNTFSYTFVTSGQYRIKAWVLDYCGNTPPYKTASKTIDFTISDPDYPSVEAVADSIAAECNQQNFATEYEKALFLHDWIIDHSTYDNSYKYMGEDGVLVRGTGTCESYYRAYALLLSKVGIPSYRAEGNGHVWSCVRLDGKWTQIDATWDCETYSDDLMYMRHLYFGITDDMMKLVHDQHAPVSGRPCTGYDNNYFIRSGEISRWTEPVRQQILEKLEEGQETFTIEPEYSPYPNVYNIIYPLTAYVLSKEDWGEYGITVRFNSDHKFEVAPKSDEEENNTTLGKDEEEKDEENPGEAVKPQDSAVSMPEPVCGETSSLAVTGISKKTAAVKKIKLYASSKTVKAGRSIKIKAKVITTGKKANKKLKWSSSNTSYATVSANGKVTAKKAGKGKTVTITAQATDGSRKKAKIKIKIR